MCSTCDRTTSFLQDAKTERSDTNWIMYAAPNRDHNTNTKIYWHYGKSGTTTVERYKNSETDRLILQHRPGMIGITLMLRNL